ncbi:hypothetical protein GCM10010406_42980 [Streptomyces thermolineatus]|uniref:M23ase beta-sheet core domain-containing protein n=1 Tax=Streptomyces thermolineatus TaxID=44033 RepID=A0ABP5ZTL3_9ACTN
MITRSVLRNARVQAAAAAARTAVRSTRVQAGALAACTVLGAVGTSGVAHASGAQSVLGVGPSASVLARTVSAPAAGQQDTVPGKETEQQREVEARTDTGDGSRASRDSGRAALGAGPEKPGKPEPKKAAPKKAAPKKAEPKKVAPKKAAPKPVKRTGPSPQGWISPVQGAYQLSASYAQSGGRWASKHSGQDYAVPTGTGINSVAAGTVVTAGWGGAYGNNIVVRHNDGHYSQYAHLSSIGVNVGERVGAGERLGLSGSTGNSTGPHLHFEIRTTPYYGSSIEPMSFLRSRGVTG